MINLSEILANSVELKRDGTRGIYFLIKGRNVVYVGQSENCEHRINSHANDKDFDRYFIFPVGNGVRL